MKKLKIILIIMILVLSVFFNYSQSEDIEFTEGEVVSILNNEIEIEEYDYNKDSYIKRVYIINSDTEILGVESVDEIAVGSMIEVEYKIDSNNNYIAVSIYVYELNE